MALAEFVNKIYGFGKLSSFTLFVNVLPTEEKKIDMSGPLFEGLILMIEIILVFEKYCAVEQLVYIFFK